MYDVGLKRDQTANQVIGHKAELEFRVEEKGDTDSAYQLDWLVTAMLRAQHDGFMAMSNKMIQEFCDGFGNAIDMQCRNLCDNGNFHDRFMNWEIIADG